MSSLDLLDVRRDFSFSLCAVPLFRFLSQDFSGTEARDRIGVVLRVRLQRNEDQGETNSIFKLRYLHDKSEVLILM